MVMRSTLILAAGLLYAGFGAAAQQPPPKLGIISMQGALAGTKDGQKALQELNSKFEPKKKEFDARQNELAQMRDQYNKSGNLMSEEKRNQLARDIDEKEKRLKRDMQDAEEELQAEQQRLVQGLAQRVMAVVEKYAKDNGYSMILDDSNPSTPVLWASTGIDITQDIIALYDKSSSNGGPVVTPAAPATKTPATPGLTPGPAASAKPPAPTPK
jgi:outer membrane protein